MKPAVERLLAKYQKRKANQPPAPVLHIARLLQSRGHSSSVSQATAWALYAKYIDPDGPIRTASELMPRIASALEQESLPLCRFIEANWSNRSVVGGIPAATGGKAIPKAPSLNYDGGNVTGEDEGDETDPVIDECYEAIREASGRAANLTAHIARCFGEPEQVAIAGGMYASQIITKLGHQLLHEI